MRETKIYQLSNNDIAITLQETMVKGYTWTFLDQMGGKIWKHDCLAVGSY
jgi:hypothetical protein